MSRLYGYEVDTVHRLFVALDEAVEEYGATVHVALVKELQSQWRDGQARMRASAQPETGLTRRRRAAGMGKPAAPVALPKGRIVAVAWREASEEAIHLLIGKWVLTSDDDELLKRAANAVETLMALCVGGEHGDRQQAVATAHEGGVAIIRQQPMPRLIFEDIGEGRD